MRYKYSNYGTEGGMKWVELSMTQKLDVDVLVLCMVMLYFGLARVVLLYCSGTEERQERRERQERQRRGRRGRGEADSQWVMRLGRTR